MVEHAVWKELINDRPWIAHLKRTLKSMTLRQGLLCVTLIGIAVYISTLSRQGTLFTETAPKWPTRLLIATLVAYFLTWITQSAQRTVSKSEKEPITPQDEALIHVEISAPLYTSMWDSGSAAIEQNQLRFTGALSAFRMDLSELVVRKVDEYEHSVALWIPRTKQRIKLRSQGGLDWKSFVEQLNQPNASTGLPSVFPPKPSASRHTFILWMLAAMVICEAITSLVWLTTKSSPIAFVVIELAALALITYGFLYVNLRLWSNRRKRLLA